MLPTKARLLFVVPMFLASLAAQTNKLDIPQNMKPYFLGMLIEEKTAAAQTQPDPSLTAKHLAYIRTQVEAGKYLVVGPTTDGDRIRGIAIVSAASVEEARKILGDDPMVKVGHMIVEVHPIMLADLSPVRTIYK